ncbi:two component histidine protein kinase [Alkalihalophilus pseudofirmus OF4]|uniref:histidine kinase n=1 Tax=Alkalihalophilus pseudofirmus (strain ATCC BAA-2126 / JCM 17055 / OF4) TaxID=398511 RepID=D3FRL8_ALKPO|nr:sensor histidine kinase [Alkalihalophilus pseudofirmus]ADC51609.1 two component histidine protein kinase [Alkalihalophilus pseudofirmus OF4]
MPSYWLWLAILGISWTAALMHTPLTPLHLIGAAIFFALFFLSALFKKREAIYTIILVSAAIVTTLTLWPEPIAAPNPFTLFIYSIIWGKALLHLHKWYAGGVGVLLLCAALTPAFLGHPSFSAMFLILYFSMAGLGFIAFYHYYNSHKEVTARNEALLSEYRKVKRQVAASEHLARQEERTQIARDIHDSVGHKLTALLMQIEVSRLKADVQTASDLLNLKELAKESLDETRSAVKTLKQDEVGGISAIINLIRKLEAENFLRIQFSLKPGAFSASLSNEQMITVYRAVQEALTNMMRHSGGREVKITFEAPAGEVFRFEVTNPLKEETPYTEGFGLKSMRERVENVSGQLEIYQGNRQFVVRGTLPIQDRKEG